MIIKNEASIRKEYELFKGNLKRKKGDNFMKLTKYCMHGSKSVARKHLSGQDNVKRRSHGNQEVFIPRRISKFSSL